MIPSTTTDQAPGHTLLAAMMAAVASLECWKSRGLWLLKENEMKTYIAETLTHKRGLPRRLSAAVIALLVIAAPVAASVVMTEDFESSNWSTNYTGTLPLRVASPASGHGSWSLSKRPPLREPRAATSLLSQQTRLWRFDIGSTTSAGRTSISPTSAIQDLPRRYSR